MLKDNDGECTCGHGKSFHTRPIIAIVGQEAQLHKDGCWRCSCQKFYTSNNLSVLADKHDKSPALD